MLTNKRANTFLKINYGLLIATVSLFYFARTIFLPLALLWLVLTFAEWNWKERYKTLKDNNLLIVASLFLFIYLLYLVGPLWSNNIPTAISEWEYKIWILVCPLCIMPLLPKLTRKQIDLLLVCFTLTILLVSLLCMAHSLHAFLSDPETNTEEKIYHFYYRHASMLPLMSFSHSSYCSMYEGIAWLIVAEFLHKKNAWMEHKALKVLFIAALIILPIHIYFLQSKMGTLTFALSLLIYIIVFFNSPKRHIIATCTVLLALAGACGWYLVKNHDTDTTNSDNRIANSISNFQHADRTDPRESTAIRLAIWPITYEIGKEHWLIGTGTGDALDEIHHKAVEHKYHYIASGKFNCHNQFLQIWLTLGLFGLIPFLAIFVCLFISALKKCDLTNILFFFIIGVNLLVECMLEVYAGGTLIPIFTVILFARAQMEPCGKIVEAA